MPGSGGVEMEHLRPATDEELAQFLADTLEPPRTSNFVFVCRDLARAVVEELLERRASDAWTSEYMRQINAEKAD